MFVMTMNEIINTYHKLCDYEYLRQQLQLNTSQGIPTSVTYLNYQIVVYIWTQGAKIRKIETFYVKGIFSSPCLT